MLVFMERMQGDIGSLHGWSLPLEAEERADHMLWHLLADLAAAL